MRIVATPTGTIEQPSEWTVADLDRRWYLIPARWHRVDGDRYACHLNQDGRPLCGATLTEPYEESKYKCAFLVCPECEECERVGWVQVGLFAEVSK